MNCPHCQHEAPSQARFCLECGHRLALACSQCATELPPDAEFCLECGQPISTACAPRQAGAQQPAIGTSDGERLHFRGVAPDTASLGGGAADELTHRFWLLLIALTALLIGYPYFGNTAGGAFFGGVTALLTLTAAVYAVRTTRWAFRGALIVALGTAVASMTTFAVGVRGHPIVEGAFSLFYAYMTFTVFLEVIKVQRVTTDTTYGAVCVYLLLGMSFANLYDLIETIQPGSFQINVATEHPEIRWRTLIFYSFMTLTTIGLGDVTPVTTQAQSLTTIEGVMGVLYVAVLIARIVGIYARRSAEE